MGLIWWQLRFKYEKYSIETDQRKTWDTWYKVFAKKTYIRFWKLQLIPRGIPETETHLRLE